jgi:hypothetical protein
MEVQYETEPRTVAETQHHTMTSSGIIKVMMLMWMSRLRLILVQAYDTHDMAKLSTTTNANADDENDVKFKAQTDLDMITTYETSRNQHIALQIKRIYTNIYKNKKSTSFGMNTISSHKYYGRAKRKYQYSC